jgi:hypothetical protein
MQDLDIRVRFFCEDLKARNGGTLPNPRGGRPDKDHEHFRIAFWINVRIAALGQKRGDVRTALWEAKKRFPQCAVFFTPPVPIKIGRGKLEHSAACKNC